MGGFSSSGASYISKMKAKVGGADTHTALTAVLKSDPIHLPAPAPGSHSVLNGQPIPLGLWLSCG